MRGFVIESADFPVPDLASRNLVPTRTNRPELCPLRILRYSRIHILGS